MDKQEHIRSFPHLQDIKDFATIFLQKGYSLYVVGGSVRDFLLKKPITDIDFSSNAKPNEILQMFPRAIPTGIRHGTLTILYKSHSFEVTSFRGKEEYSNFRSPDSVEFTQSLEEDLKRRDFTINAMILDPLKETISDYYDGHGDIERKTIRCVGTPHKRYTEDALRMLRAVRFACTLSFSIEKASLEGIYQNAGLIVHVSKERIWQELRKMFLSDNAAYGLRLLCNSGLFYHVFYMTLSEEELKDSYMNLLYSAKKQDALRFSSEDEILHLRIACCIGQESTTTETLQKILTSLKLSRQSMSMLRTILYYRKHGLRRKNNTLWSAFKISSFVRVLGKKDALLVLQYHKLVALSQEDSASYDLALAYEKHIDALQEMSLKTLALNGSLIKKEFPLLAGKKIGQLLQTVLRYVTQHPQKNKEAILLGYIREISII